jgi:hypothetical protein
MAKKGLGFVTYALALAALCACSDAPTGIASIGVASTATAFDPGPALTEFQLTGFDVATRTLTGVTRLPELCDRFTPTDPCRFRLNASLTADTELQAADLDRYSPTDPCRALSLNYNTIVIDTPPDAAIAALAAQGCNARVFVDQKAGTILKFQPVP